MGWLGWTEAQTLDATPDTIRLARDGRVEMIDTVLRAVFPPDPKAESLATQRLEHRLSPTGQNLQTVFRSLAEAGEKPA